MAEGSRTVGAATGESGGSRHPRCHIARARCFVALVAALNGTVGLRGGAYYAKEYGTGRPRAAWSAPGTGEDETTCGG